jgi:hypothetical protein
VRREREWSEKGEKEWRVCGERMEREGRESGVKRERECRERRRREWREKKERPERQEEGMVGNRLIGGEEEER